MTRLRPVFTAREPLTNDLSRGRLKTDSRLCMGKMGESGEGKEVFLIYTRDKDYSPLWQALCVSGYWGRGIGDSGIGWEKGPGSLGSTIIA